MPHLPSRSLARRSHASTCGAVALLVLAAAACSEGVVSPRERTVESRIDSLVALEPNALAFRVFATIRGADSACVEVVGATDGLRRSPMVRVSEGPNALLVLGLRQGERYTARVVTRSRGGTEAASAGAERTTDSLPLPLRALRFNVSGTASAGYTIFPAKFDSTGYIVAVDSLGAVRWYFDVSGIIPNAAVGDIKQLRGGGFLAYVGLTSGWQPVAGRFYHIAADGAIVRSVAAPVPLYMDNHEIVPLYAGDSLVGAIFTGYDLRTLDMSSYGGSAEARVAGHYLLRQRLSGEVEFFWSAWDHFTLADWIEDPPFLRTWNPIDFDHPNAIAVDHDGNYLVSWRHLAEITKIDARSGEIRWRWGGAHNQFTTVGDPLAFFSGQHSLQVLANGNYLLYDNGLRHAPPESRAVEYRVDPVARTATMVWQYRHTPPLYTAFTGSVQRLANGNTLIGWAGIGMASEVSADGQLLWEGTVTQPGGFSTYRMKRIRSLYADAGP